MIKKIKKAVFPVAGLGTRFLPATKACPKEMLPVVDKPLIQYALEEAAEAGITDMIFVTGRSKRAIEDHFDRAFELEQDLEKKNSELIDVVRNIPPKGINCIYIRQAEPLGLGHAVYCAYPAVGDEPFAILLADDLMDSNSNHPGVMTQMVRQYERTGESIIAVEEIPWGDTNKYGIVENAFFDDNLSKVINIVEKPDSKKSPSNIAVVGRYVLAPKIFQILKHQEKGKGGEIQLTDAISKFITTETVLSYKFLGNRYDCGSKQGYLRATVSLGRKHIAEGKEFNSWLKELTFWYLWKYHLNSKDI